MTSWTRIYVKHNFAKFHPDPIWNDGALSFLKSVYQQEQEVNEEDDDDGCEMIWAADSESER